MGGGSDGSGGGGSSTTTLYNWKNLLPPWVQSGQQSALPWLLSRASSGGLLPSEEKTLWGGVKTSLDDANSRAGRSLASKMSSSGISASSPAAAGAFADLASDRVSNESKAALDFAKMKIGARDTAIGHMLTALYTPPPVATGQSSYTAPTTRGK